MQTIFLLERFYKKVDNYHFYIRLTSTNKGINMDKNIQFDRNLQIADKIVITIGVLFTLTLGIGLAYDTKQYNKAKQNKIEQVSNTIGQNTK